MSRNPAKANLPEGVEVVAGDLNEPDTLQTALEGVNGLILIISSDEANATLQNQPKVMELAEQAGVKRVAVLIGYEEGPVEEALKNTVTVFVLRGSPVEAVFLLNALKIWRIRQVKCHFLLVIERHWRGTIIGAASTSQDTGLQPILMNRQADKGDPYL